MLHEQGPPAQGPGFTCSKLLLDSLFLKWFALPESQTLVRERRPWAGAPTLQQWLHCAAGGWRLAAGGRPCLGRRCMAGAVCYSICISLIESSPVHVSQPPLAALGAGVGAA